MSDVRSFFKQPAVAKTARRINPVSRKQRAKNTAYSKWRPGFLAMHSRCEIPFMLGHVADHNPHATIIHHRRLRKQGGGLTNELNTIAVCPACHDIIHRFPSLAHDKGLLVWAGDLDYLDCGEL